MTVVEIPYELDLMGSGGSALFQLVDLSSNTLNGACIFLSQSIYDIYSGEHCGKLVK